MRDRDTQTRNWPELAIGLYDQLTGRGSEITYAMENLEVAVPSGTGPDADFAQWKVNGVVRISTRDQRS